MVKKETQGRLGKIGGQPAHTRETKLGCVFTQTHGDKEGYAIRDPDSTTYTGAIETAIEFGKRIYLEAWKRGWSRAIKKVVIGDGAEWIWNLVAEHFPSAIQIVDLYHARQHLWDVARQLYPHEEVQQKAWMKLHQKRLLDKGKIEKLVDLLQSIDTANLPMAEKIRAEADYFKRNAERMRYPKFRRQHLFVGSGVIEAGCKTVIGSRLKQSGMFWTVRGANAILALRCSHLNGRFEDYWEGHDTGQLDSHFYVAHPTCFFAGGPYLLVAPSAPPIASLRARSLARPAGKPVRVVVTGVGFVGCRTPESRSAAVVACAQSQPLLPQVAFVLDEYCQLLEVPGFPVAQIGFQNHMGRLENPTQLGLVGKPDTHIEHSFLKDVLGPVHDLASHAGVLLAWHRLLTLRLRR